MADLLRLRDNDKLNSFIDRLGDLYGDLEGFDHTSFWRGMAKFVAPESPSWAKDYLGKVWHIDAYAELLMRWCGREHIRTFATEVFKDLKSRDEISLISRWLRKHAFVHGLHGEKAHREYSWFLSAERTIEEIRDRAHAWRELHLQGRLLPSVWDTVPLFIIHVAGLWCLSGKRA